MLNLLASIDPPSIWNAPNGSSAMYLKLLLALVVGLAMLFGCMAAPTQLRKPIIVAVTFLSGLYYVVFWLFPTPIGRGHADAPKDAADAVSFWLSDSQTLVANISNILSAFMIGLGIYSLLRIHVRRFVKQQPDWGYSVVLLVSMVVMAIFGFWDFHDRIGTKGALIATGPQSGAWGFQQYAYDLLFFGLYQQMEAGMFSMVAFYIMSAAYRAFRARSIEATILLGSALVVLLNVMGPIQYVWDELVISNIAHKDPAAFLNNFKLGVMAPWLQSAIQTPAIRGIDFGVGLGLLAMGLRLWLSFEGTGGEE